MRAFDVLPGQLKIPTNLPLSVGDVEAALGVCVYLLNDAQDAQQTENIQKLAQALTSQVV